MPRITVDPPVRLARQDRAFLQLIQLKDGEQIVGRAVWASSHTHPDVAQLITLEVDPELGRKGHGSQLMLRVFEESAKRANQLDKRLRRVWLTVEQTTQIHARGFLTRHGFHHVKTIDALLKGESAMVYVKSFD